MRNTHHLLLRDANMARIRLIDGQRAAVCSSRDEQGASPAALMAGAMVSAHASRDQTTSWVLTQRRRHPCLKSVVSSRLRCWTAHMMSWENSSVFLEQKVRNLPVRLLVHELIIAAIVPTCPSP